MPLQPQFPSITELSRQCTKIVTPAEREAFRQFFVRALGEDTRASSSPTDKPTSAPSALLSEATISRLMTHLDNAKEDFENK